MISASNDQRKQTENWPRVSFIVFGYQHERFIAEAVQSALAQSGPSIEILLSDDASPDRTFEVMQELAANYRGPHRVVLNRNESNVGLAGHVNRAWQLCHGDFVVVQSGDDISLPDRTEKLVRHWLDSDRRLDLVCSFFEEINEVGLTTGRVKKEVVFVPEKGQDVSDWRCGATGACAAYSRKLYEKYGPLNDAVASEDWVLSFRAWLEGGIGLVEEPLVKHRTHEASMSVMAKNFSRQVDRQTRFNRRFKMERGTLAIREEWLKAWRIAKPGLDTATERALERLILMHRARLEAYTASWLSQFGIFCRVLRAGGVKSAASHCVRHILGIQ